MPTSSAFLSVCAKCHAWCCNAVMPPVTKQERDIILQGGFPDYFIQIDEDMYQIRAEDQKPCPYLTKDMSCGIQEVKPRLCKVWPVIPRISHNKKEFILLNCPITSTLLPSDIQRAKKEAEALPVDLIVRLWELSQKHKNRYKRFTYTEI
jgi:Fe-S-cluster containining protein